MNSPKKNRRIRLLCLVLALGTFFLYFGVLRDGFISLDDGTYVTANGQVQRGLSAKGMVWAFKTVGFGGNWHPLTWISHMLDCSLYGVKSAAGHHLTNVLFHVANTLLLFILLEQMTGALWRSAFVAALFAWHPVHVESVAWIAERKDVLAGFFWLLTMLVYVRYVNEAKARGDRTRLYYILVLVCFALGLMSKPMVVTLPFVLLLMDFWPLNRIAVSASNTAQSEAANSNQPGTCNLKSVITEKLPLLALSAVSCVLTVIAQNKAGAVSSLATVPFGDRLANSVVSYVRYLGKMFWPVNLAIYYPLQHHAVWVLASCCLLLVLVTVLAVVMMRRQPWLLVGWLWFLGTLVPVIGLVQVGQQSIADRYTYLPSIGIFIAVVWSGAALASLRPQLSRAAIFGGSFALAILALLTEMQLSYWKNSVALFTHAMQVTSTNSMALLGLGIGLERQGQKDEAMEKFNLAMQLDPTSASTLQAIALNYSSRGKYDEAIGCYKKALTFMDAPGIHYNLGNALAAKRQFAEAEAQYKEALRGDPDSPDAHNNLGAMLLREGRPDEALQHFEAALEIEPNYPEAHDELASIWLKKGRLDLARMHYDEAVRLKPDFAHAQLKLGIVMAEQGDVGFAIPHFEKAISLEPTNADAYFDLGAAYAALENWPSAVDAFSSAARLKPSSLEYQRRLADAKAKLGGKKAAN